ncbi:MAG TPA: amino acid adenylation domain-containing protein [Thermoanaerobaculia bacterium]|nr:amino acid adenylation domain-containing protein [Thermoanaerobaculia bacterium]
MDAKKRELLDAVLRQRGVDPASLPILPRPECPDGTAPLSLAQERLWVAERLEPGRPTYNEAYAICFTGALSPAALAAALRETARRHDALRTGFASHGGQPVQVISPAAVLSLPVTDLAALAPAEREAAAGRCEREMAERPFDLQRGPLVRALLLRCGGQEHRLILVLHHIICDATSIEILVGELVALHSAFARGAGSPLPAPQLQYADFAAWQRERQAPVLARQLAAWKERLAGAPTVLELPADRPRTDGRSGHGAALSAPLPAPLSRAVKALAQAEQATLFMTLLAAFQVLVAKSTGRLDFLLGSPIAGRTRPEVREMLGFFVNTLAIRADLAGDPTFREVLGRVRRTVAAAYDHQDVPFGRLVEEMRPERAASHAPLVQVLFLLQKPGVRLETGADLDFSMRRIATATAKFELTFLARDSGEEIVCGVEYDSDLFLAATMARFLERYRVLLEAVVADPEVRLSDLELLTTEERRQNLGDWQGPRVERPWEAGVHELVARQALRTPDAAAVIAEERTLSYRELIDAARRFARRLRALGVRTDDLVGLCLQPSPDLMVAVLGILTAGGAYVPLDPGQPAERLAWILEDTGLRVVVTENALADRLPATAVAVLRIDAERESLAELPTGPVEARALPASLAYLIYTSGSTGRPKGVMVPHGGLVNLVLSFAASFRLGPGERMLQLLSLAFDASVGDLFPPLVSGAALVLHRDPQSLLGRDLGVYLDRQRITCIELATAFWQQWAEALAARGQAPPASLRTLIAGGEAVTLDKVRTWFHLLGGRPFRFRNHYGPTEATVCATAFQVEGAAVLDYARLPIGRPLPNVRVHLLGSDLRLVPVGAGGEICIGGSGIARGYLGRPDATAERFVPDPFGAPGDRLYRTGDLARWLPGGDLDFLGRVDHQVKIRGYRVEPGEVEAALAGHPAVREVMVMARADGPGPQRLVAYVVPAIDPAPGAAELRTFLKTKLPAHMVPEAFVTLERFPVNTSGKVDRKALPRPVLERAEGEPFAAPESPVQQKIAAVWRELLGIERAGLHDNFFDLGGHSLLLIRMEGLLRDALGRPVEVIDLFRHPTIASLASHLEAIGTAPAVAPAATQGKAPGREIAVIGMAGRFPGARDVDQLWRNLCGGVESITFFSAAELLAAGVAPELLAAPEYVRAKGALDGADRFDAAFFGFSPREAELLDPQHRFFLECAWEALESAGCDPERFPGPVGVFAGVGRNSYFVNNLLTWPQRLQAAGVAQAVLGNEKDFLPTRASYKLDLRGPSVAVQTACSTSLVAVHLACRSLLDGECDAALAGGVTIPVPQAAGYVYEEGGIFSPDGHCRAFDAAARGTVPGSGVGIVVLKRLADAVADGDFIHGVIKGSAINNDGSLKVGYTAPSPEGQVRVLREALSRAGVPAGSIGYVETHGTGTQLGDLIEISALREVFAGLPSASCALGALKPNVGHMDDAAGVGGLIKALLALRHGRIPPTLHFRMPDPRLGLDGGPFYVNAELRDWPQRAGPRRAGVSSFGIGGTNAHVIVEEAPAPVSPAPGAPWQLLPLSARGEEEVQAATRRLASALAERSDVQLSDTAWTLQTGRRGFAHRRFAVCRDTADAVAVLAGADPGRLSPVARLEERLPVAFLFPGQGAHAVGIGRELFASLPVFAAAVDRCSELLAPHLGLDLRHVLFPTPGGEAEAEVRLTRTEITQPALFTVSWALAELWRSWGVEPAAMLGHSLGDYVAACRSGVFGLEDALELVALRGRLMQALPAGAMLSVLLPEAELRWLLSGGLELSAVNGPAACTVSGPPPEIEAFGEHLRGLGIEGRRLRVSHAFHSAAMDPILGEMRRAFERIALRPPQIPFVSSRTGDWITPGEAVSPEYWVRHLREEVRFAAALDKLLLPARFILLEAGPGRVLSSFAKRHPGRSPGQRSLASLPGTEGGSELADLLTACGRLWMAGVEPRWEALHPQRPRRVPLPAYPFAGRSYWIAPASETAVPAPEALSRTDAADRFHVLSWQRLPPSPPGASPAEAAVGPIVDLRSLDGDAGTALLSLAESLGEAGRKCRVTLAVSGGQEVAGEAVDPGRAALFGLAAALRRRGIPCGAVDLAPGAVLDESLVDRLTAEAAAGCDEVVWRGGRRWVRTFAAVRLPAPAAGGMLPAGGVFAVSGAAGALRDRIATALELAGGRPAGGPPGVLVHVLVHVLGDAGRQASPAAVTAELTRAAETARQRGAGSLVIVVPLTGGGTEGAWPEVAREVTAAWLGNRAGERDLAVWGLVWDDRPGSILAAAGETLDALRRALSLEAGALVFVSADVPSRWWEGAGQAAVPPSGPGDAVAEGSLERRIAALWEDLLGIDRIGAADDYFELGGDSLLAIRLLSRLRQELGIEVSLQSFLAAPTVAGLAGLVPETVPENIAKNAGAPGAIPRAGRDRLLPLSFVQEDTWHNLRRPSGLLQHNASAAYRGTGTLHREALESSLNEVARRHEILRTTFPEVAGRPVQVIAAAAGLTLPLVDLSGLPGSRREAEAHRIAVAAYWERFDVAAGPLLRVIALRFGPRDHGLLRAVGRLVTDGGSLQILIEELMAFYDGFLAGRLPELPEPPIQYADFAAWQRQAVEGEAMREHLAWWRQTMRGAPDRLRLRTDFPPPAVPAFRGARVAVPISAGETDVLKALGRAEGATLFMVLLTLYGVLLHGQSGEDDFVVATPMSHRVPETERVMGRFLNTLALRFDLTGDLPFRTLLRRVREACFGAYAHKDLPYERMVEEIGVRSDGSYRPLCQVSFVLQEIALPDFRLGAMELHPFLVQHGGSDFELTLGFSQDAAGGLDGFLEYSTELFSAATAAALAARVRRLAAAVVNDPLLRVSELMDDLDLNSALADRNLQTLLV